MDHSSAARKSASFWRRGIEHQLAAVFNPQENGLVEHWNRTMKMGIQAFIASGKAWEEGLQELLMQHRALPMTPEGCSLAKLLMG